MQHRIYVVSPRILLRSASDGHYIEGDIGPQRPTLFPLASPSLEDAQALSARLERKGWRVVSIKSVPSDAASPFFFQGE